MSPERESNQSSGSEPYVITYDDAKHKYWIDGEPVSSVTQILDEVTNKPALVWWGMRIGMAAVVQLAASGDSWAQLATANTYAEIVTGQPREGAVYFTKNDKNLKKPKTFVEQRVTDEKLTVNHVKETAGDRGTSIHVALEQLGVGTMPSLDDYPPEHHGFIAGLCQWWLDHEPDFLEQEIIVGSKVHNYAGRFDIVPRYNAGAFKGQRGLADLKTSKAVYMNHLVQLDAYEIAYREMEAGEDFEFRQVLHVPGDGSYSIVTSRLDRGAFLPRVALFNQQRAEIKIHKELA